MHKMKIQFGKQEPVVVPRNRVNVKSKKYSDVKEDGLESNAHTKYDAEVKFENIVAKVNVAHVKSDDRSVGVAKGAILAGVPITVPKNDANSTIHAMKKRCDFSPEVTSLHHFKKGHGLLMEKFRPLDVIRVDEELLYEYFNSCKPSKAERLERAWKGDELTYDGERKHVFAKQEVLLKDHGSQPRIVYQGTDMYNAMTGAVVMEVTRRLKKVFSLSNPDNVGNRVIFACGSDSSELGNIIGNAPGEVIESDMKNNDGSQSGAFRKYEAMFYKKLGAPDWFVREFAKNTQVSVWTRYGVAAQVQGQRWSGESTTTTGNSYVSMVLILAALDEAKVEESTNIHGGDDYLGVVVGGEAFADSITKVVTPSGMKAEVVKPPTRDHATFYRKRYVRAVGKCRPVPQFGRVLAKLNLRANQNSQVGDREYMAGKYYSAAYEHRHVPVIGNILLEYASMFSEKPFFDVRSSKLEEMGGVEAIRGFVGKDILDDDSFSCFLDNVYGVSQHELEQAYRGVAQSCMDYLDGWTFVRAGKPCVKQGYHPPKVVGEVFEALIKLDT